MIDSILDSAETQPVSNLTVFPLGQLSIKTHSEWEHLNNFSLPRLQLLSTLAPFVVPVAHERLTSGRDDD